MAVYMYAPQIKKGTRELLETLDAKRLVRFDGMQFLHKGKPLIFDEVKDVIICWGSCVPPIGKLRILNSSIEYPNTLELNKKLQRIAGGNNSYFAAAPLIPLTYGGRALGNTPMVRDPDWGQVVPSNDFPGYASSFARLTNEYELHICNKKLLIAYKKVATMPLSRDDAFSPAHAHKWYKSRSAGWDLTTKFKTDISKVTAEVIKFLEDCNLNFGAVSIGGPQANAENNYDYPAILRKIIIAPELNDAEVKLYAAAIKQWIQRS